MKVLLPIDGSTAAHTTLSWATQYLDPACAQLYLLYVVPWSVDALEHEQEANEAREILNREQDFLQREGFQVARAEHLSGTPAQKVCEYADEVGADQIIIGSRGKGKLTKLLLGSVSRGVFECATVPVLLLNNTAKPVLEMSHPEQINIKPNERRIRKVLIPVDRSKGSRRTLEWAAEFLNPDSTEVHLLHAYSHSPEGGYRHPEFNESETALINAEKFMRNRGFEVITQCVMGAPDTVTCDYADEANIDQIIIGSHGEQGINKFLMGSVTQGVLKCTEHSVVVLNNTDKATLKVSNPENPNFSPGQC